MASTSNLIVPRLPRGLGDRTPADIAAVDAMIATVLRVYARYGFDPVETPLIEFTEALGKYLPDTDRPNAGVFSFQDEDDQWLSLRYDLTAPLARYVAEHYDRLPRPFRSYRAGWVFRNEKPGPGRFRQFMQLDADTVGAPGAEADAEMAMMMADVMDALGLAGKYVVRVNNRKVLDGARERIGVAGDHQWLVVMRALDKLDRLGLEGVRLLLGAAGRTDESGDHTAGAGLLPAQVDELIHILGWERPAAPDADNAAIVRTLADGLRATLRGSEGADELMTIAMLAGDAYAGRVRIDPSVVRGLEYYTGPVFEIELTFPVTNEKGEQVVFGSVGGGGRYDGLVSRFRSEPVPATGFSLGVSRLATALRLTGNLALAPPPGPVVVLVMDRGEMPRYQQLTARLRAAGIRAEMYLGAAGMNAQMKYANRRNAPAVVIEGSVERSRGRLTVKDLVAGAEAAKAIKDNLAWKAERPGQFDVGEDELVSRLMELPGVRAGLVAK